MTKGEFVVEINKFIRKYFPEVGRIPASRVGEGVHQSFRCAKSVDVETEFACEMRVHFGFANDLWTVEFMRRSQGVAIILSGAGPTLKDCRRRFDHEAKGGFPGLVGECQGMLGVMSNGLKRRKAMPGED